MTAADAEAAIRRFIEHDLFAGAPPIPIADDTDLLATGLLDSVTVVLLVGFLEERFAVRLGDEHLVPEHLGSLDRLVALVTRLAGPAAPQAASGGEA
jgi:acyl carrier protein